MESKVSTDINRYLTFRLAEEVFALDVADAKEVLDYTHITVVPKVSKHIAGVLNLRGAVIPVVNMRNFLHLEENKDKENSNIIFVEVNNDHGRDLVGVQVDAVEEVVALKNSEIEPPPTISNTINKSFIHGMGKIGEKLILILNVDRVFALKNFKD